MTERAEIKLENFKLHEMQGEGEGWFRREVSILEERHNLADGLFIYIEYFIDIFVEC